MSGPMPSFNPNPMPRMPNLPAQNMYPGPLRMEEIQDRVQSGDLEKALIHADPNHKEPDGPHLDVKLWEKDCLKPQSFKVADVLLSRQMTDDIEFKK